MKRKTIKKFLTLMAKDTGEDLMPDHLWVRWHGLDGRFYNKLWKRLDGDNDIYLFEDVCDIGFELAIMGEDTKLKELHGDRLNKLYRYSKDMLDHYIMVTFFWKAFGFLIIKVIRPLMYKVVIPLYTLLRFAWMGWVLFTSIILDFLKEFGKFLIGRDPS